MNRFRMVAVAIVVLAILALLAWPKSADAQSLYMRTKTFPLNTQFYSAAVFCPIRKDAIDMALAGALVGEVALLQSFKEKFANEACTQSSGYFVFHEQVIRVLQKDGVSLSIYEAVLDHETIYALIQDWTGVLPGSI